MVEFNRRILLNDIEMDVASYEIDPKIDEVLQYINVNLQNDLSIEALSQRFYISRYHFMRRFKEAAGYTIHSYVLQKRLGKAAELIGAGMIATEAALAVGFSDYSSFLRSFKLVFNLTPRQYADWKRGK
jgi:AraC-like DNA-binding protein